MSIEDIYEEDAGTGKEPTVMVTACGYLRGYARHPCDRATELMPQDGRWTRAVRRLYDELAEAEREVIDSYGEDVPSIDKRTREQALKRIAQKLLIRAGIESNYTIILLPQRKENEK